MQFRDHTAVVGKRDFYSVDPDALKIEPGYNVRDFSSPEMKAYISELKDSIIANGIKVPLEVRLKDDDIFVIAGHCRLAAVKLARKEGNEIKSVPVIPEAKGVNDEDRTLNLIVSNSGKPLSPLETATVVKRLVDFGWSSAQIATRCGWRSSTQVDNYLTLLSADPEARQMVRDGEVSASTVVKEVRSNPRTATETLKKAKAIAKKRGKKKVTAKTVKAAKGQLDLKPKQIKSLVTALKSIAKYGDERSIRTATNALSHVGIKVE